MRADTLIEAINSKKVLNMDIFIEDAKGHQCPLKEKVFLMFSKDKVILYLNDQNPYDQNL